MRNGAGIISKLSANSFDETLDRFVAILQERRITLFSRIDHSGEAEKVGLKMPPTVLLIFGNPVAGTAIMLSAPTAAIDLPLKVLVSQDSDGKVWLSYNDPEYLKQRFELSPEHSKTLAVVGNLVDLVVA